jgi:MFS family permease
VLVLALGAACFVVAYAGLALTGADIVALAVLFAAAGVGIGFAETAEHAAVATLAPHDVRGSAFGVLSAIQSFGNLAASAVAGVLWSVVSPEAAFWFWRSVWQPRWRRSHSLAARLTEAQRPGRTLIRMCCCTRSRAAAALGRPIAGGR